MPNWSNDFKMTQTKCAWVNSTSAFLYVTVLIFATLLYENPQTKRSMNSGKIRYHLSSLVCRATQPCGYLERKKSQWHFIQLVPSHTTLGLVMHEAWHKTGQAHALFTFSFFFWWGGGGGGGSLIVYGYCLLMWFFLLFILYFRQCQDKLITFLKLAALLP